MNIALYLFIHDIHMYFIESKGILLYKVIISTLYESKYFIILIFIVKYLQIYNKNVVTENQNY